MTDTSKKPAPKKSAKKAAAKKPAAKKPAPGPLAKRIVIVAKENPRRPGTDRHRFFEIARKSSTVEAYLAAGGHLPSLRKCVSRGWIKLT